MLPQPVRKPLKSAEEKPRRWRKAKWLLLLLVPLIAWQTWRMVSSGRQLNAALALQAKLDDRSLSSADREKLFRDMRTTMANLTPDQRKVLSNERQKRQEQEFNRYFALNKVEQRKFLDDRINAMVLSRNAANARGTATQKGPTGGIPGGMSPVSFGTMGGKGPGGKGPSGKGSTPDEIENRKKQMLQSTSADFRAKNDRFRHDLEQRMKERGIAPPQGGRR